MRNVLKANIEEAVATLRSLGTFEAELDRAAEIVAGALTTDRKLLTCGNGGSAADAAHFATEFVCRYKDDRRPYPAISLNSSGGDLTAIGNDYAFVDIFSRQVHAFGQPDDVLLVFTTSGRSENVRRALDAARERRLRSIAFLGRDGGACCDLAEVQFVVPGTLSARIQEAHKLLLHTLCEMVEQVLPRE